jgi:hypothetical protein
MASASAIDPPSASAIDPPFASSKDPSEDPANLATAAADIPVVSKNVQTFGIIEKNSKSIATGKNFYIDESEGLGAFLNIIVLGGDKIGPKNVDVGGGDLDYNSGILKQFFNIDNFVFDPYSGRKGQVGLEKEELSAQHGFIIEQIQGAADTATSFSILNVLVTTDVAGNNIFNREAAKDHLKLALSCLKKNGVLYIKVYEGNKSNVITPGHNFSQTNFVFDNKEYTSLIEEICDHETSWKLLDTNYEYKYYIIQKIGNRVFGGKKTKKVKKNLKNKSKKSKKQIQKI